MTTSIETFELPATVRAFLAAHAAGDSDLAARAFTADAVVTDEGQTYRGADEVRRFLEEAGSQFTYTTALVGAERVGETRWVAVNRLEGDFPGGVAELRFRFRLVGDLVAELSIGP
ncbi:nuclear transport factor 2 family protein [Nocardioides aurantiacus]|nr:nuclear transport factor 2 family protein [Nocardioides aurantiacus]